MISRAPRRDRCRFTGPSQVVGMMVADIQGGLSNKSTVRFSMDLGSWDRRHRRGCWGDRLPRRPNGHGGYHSAGWQRGRLPRLRRLRLLSLLRPVLAAADRVLLLPVLHVALMGTRSLGPRRIALPRSHARLDSDDAARDPASGCDECLSRRPPPCPPLIWGGS